MDDLKSKIRRLIESLLSETAVHLVELELRGSIGSQVLKVFVDTEEGITLEQITRLTRDIDALLETADLMPGAFRLEVSSPGVESGLKFGWQYRRHLGRNLWVRFAEGGEEHEYSGKLSAFENDQIELQVKKDKITIPLASVIKARVQLKW